MYIEMPGVVLCYYYSQYHNSPLAPIQMKFHYVDALVQSASTALLNLQNLHFN